MNCQCPSEVDLTRASTVFVPSFLILDASPDAARLDDDGSLDTEPEGELDLDPTTPPGLLAEPETQYDDGDNDASESNEEEEVTDAPEFEELPLEPEVLRTPPRVYFRDSGRRSVDAMPRPEPENAPVLMCVEFPVAVRLRGYGADISVLTATKRKQVLTMTPCLTMFTETESSQFH